MDINIDVSKGLEIVNKLPANLKREAAEIYYEAFEQKIKFILSPRKKAILFLERALNTDLGIYAIYNKRLVGFTGLEFLGHKSMKINYSDLASVFGIFSAIPKWLILKLTNHYRLRKGELWINPIAVSKPMRRKKIGTKMLEATFVFAKQNNFNTVKLHVIDTNLGARELYHRMGFEPIKTRNYYFLTQVAGFSSVIAMEKKIK